MKKLLSILLSVILILMVCPIGVFELSAFAETSGNYTYTVSNGEATITKCSTPVGSISIPSTLGGYPVTSIGSNAFSYYSRLTSITIPDSVTSIGDNAFYGCTGLKEVTIPDSVTSIGRNAFRGCTRLTSIAIPDSVTSIGSEAFYYCTGLTSVIIPDSVTSIGSEAFEGCTGLTSITIPDSVTSIGEGAFSGCTGLTSVTIGNSVTSIGSEAFSGCNNLNYNTYKYGKFLGNDKNPYLYLAKAEVSNFTGEFEFAPDVKIIGDSAFRDCYGLKSITIPDSVTEIGYYAFSGCVGLSSITIPDSVTSIGNSAFSGCTGLASITIPNNVTSIGNYAFCACTGLTSITIPNSVTSIGEYAFQVCTRLTSITISNSVTSIGVCAFDGCTGLTSIAIPDSVTSIGSNAFSGCSGLTSITIPDSVTSIGNSAFSGCTGLKEVNYTGSLEEAEAINIDSGNGQLFAAKWNFNTITDPEKCKHTETVWKTEKNPSLYKTGIKKKVCSVCGKVLEAEEIPVLDPIAPRIEFECDRAVIGGNAEVRIVLKNNPGITSLKLNISYDSDLTLKSIEYNSEIGGISQQPYSLESPVNLNWINGIGNTGGDFVFATLKFKISKDADTGIKSITANYNPDDIFNVNDTNIEFAVVDGEIDVKSYKPGDVSDDGELNNKDLTRLFQYLSDWPVDINEAALDVNGDGKVNNKDLTRLFQYLSDWDVEIF